ncbi:MAG: alpha/beta hydrolase [Chloroflexi bacterium]|nr:alpha/beta hydrolase [Chloroflexota bacterium]MDA1003191.1 alpha/beta hydrolase [Chloroflexota bacterium]
MPLTTQTVDDAQIRVWSAGSGSPLLFLHGFEQHPGDAPFLQRLAQSHSVYAPELPGYGESTGFESIHDIFDMAMRFRRLVEHLGTGPVDVIGHCLGGMIAGEFAATSPHLVRKLVLVDAWGLWIDADQPADPFVLNPEQLKQAKWHDVAAAERETSIAQSHPDGANAAMLLRQQNLGVATKFMWPIADRGLSRRLPYVSTPTLIVHGESDGLIPSAYADEFARLLPNAEVARISGAGHLPQVEREDAFITAVETFLAK